MEVAFVNIYDKIEMLCKEYGKTVTQMCREAGVSRTSIFYLKSGNRESISTKSIEKIAKYFGVPIGDIFENEKNPQAERAGDLQLTERERRLIIAFRSQPDLQYAVERLLGVEQDGIGQSGQELA